MERTAYISANRRPTSRN